MTALEVNAEINIARIVKLFRQLQQGPYKDSADVGRIDYLLHKKGLKHENQNLYPTL